MQLKRPEKAKKWSEKLVYNVVKTLKIPVNHSVNKKRPEVETGSV